MTDRLVRFTFAGSELATRRGFVTPASEGSRQRVTSGFTDAGFTEQGSQGEGANLMADFPPIADYGFLSDCEDSCLMASGRLRRVALPAPAGLAERLRGLLDRTAGMFRFGPANTHVPHQRRYLPGTMVLETTWHTPTGWLVVQDFLVIRPVERRASAGRLPAGPRRTPRPRDARADGHLHRAARSRSSPTACRSSSTGPRPVDWGYDGDGLPVDDGPAARAGTRPLHRDGQPAARHRRRSLLRTHHPRGG